MTELVLLLVIFIGMGCAFLLLNLFLGRFFRPQQPSAEKETIYECGEPTIGGSWIQFDLRFYVVALLFVIFDVEMAFFFPWATVFGSANKLADEQTSAVQKMEAQGQLIPNNTAPPANEADQAKAAKGLAWVAFYDIVIFFSVLLVGFAYLWKRGDLDWVRSTAAQTAVTTQTAPQPPPTPAPVVAGK